MSAGRRALWAITAAAVGAAVLVGLVRRRQSADPAPPEVSQAHRRLVDALRDARRRGDRDAAADAQGELGREAFAAAERATRAWVAQRDPVLGMLPRDFGAAQPIWNYKDVAADCYPHFVIAAHVVAPDLLPALRAMLETDRRLFPNTTDLRSGAPLPMTDDERAFGAAEYAKDGLLAVLECLGDTPWADRLNEVADQIWVLGARPTRGGNHVILGQAETNGETLQVLARLWQRTHGPRHLARGREIADAYVQEVFPATGDLPPHDFDFTRGVATDPRVKLRDHGNEMVAGLVEWTLVERLAPDSRLPRYAPAVQRMLDRLLDVGRSPDGLWLHEVGQPTRPDGMLNDNWGYVSSAFVAYALSLSADDPRRPRYLDAARQSMRAATARHGANWEHGRMDGFADTIESALYMLAFLDEPNAADWVDEEVGRLLAYQQPDGFATRMYLDGNFVRTSLLFALWKTAGIRAVPWRPDLRVGAERDGDGWRIAVHADAPWHGVLRFDGARHREILHLADNYPRLNAWPEWFAVQPDAAYQIEDRASGARSTRSGAELRAGLPLDLDSQRIMRWRVAPFRLRQ